MADETQMDAAEAPETTETPVEETQVEQAEAEVKPHPAHEKLLNELPEAWHQKVLPHLQEQDKYFQQEIEKYTPYKEFVEAGVSPEVIQGGINLARAIETQPMDVYESLTDYLKTQGLIGEEAKAAAKEIMEEESGENFADMFDGEEIPSALKKEIEELKQFKTQQEQYVQDQQLQAETEKHLEILETEMTQLRQKHNISEAHEIAIYDLMNAAINAGRDISVADAAQQLGQMIGGLPSAQASQEGEPAPTVIGSGGGAGVQAQNLEIPKDMDAKKEMLTRMFEEYKKSAQ